MKRDATGQQKEGNKAYKHRKLTDQTLNLDSNRQYKETESQEDERDAAGLLYFPWGHERNCHHWSCPVLNKSPALQREMKNNERLYGRQKHTNMHTHKRNLGRLIGWKRQLCARMP